MLPSIKQFKAARALLGWTQEDLSFYSLLDIDKIRRFESERTRSVDTIVAMQRAFETAGIVFTPRGCEMRDDGITTIGGITIIEGAGWWLRLLRDVHATLKNAPNKEFLLFCADDRESPPAVNDAHRAMRADGVQMRQLVEEGNPYLMGPLEEYRYIPKGYFKNYVSGVYADKVVVCTAANTKAVIFKDADMAAERRNLFNLLFSMLPKPTKSNADELF